MAHGLNRRLLDAHIHLWDLAATPQDWIDPVTMAAIDRDFAAADLDAQLSAVDVEWAVAVQADHSLAETRMLLDATLLTDRLVGVVGWVDAAGDVAGQVAELQEHPAGDRLVGIRHLAHTPGHEDWLTRADVAAGVRTLGDLALSVDLVVRDHQLRDARTLALAAPDTTFVLDHLAKPALATGDLATWRTDLAALAELPNVVAKLSGLTIEADWQGWSIETLSPAVSHALEVFGSDRLMFGSDWPLIRLTAGEYAGWVEAYVELTGALSPDEQAAIDQHTARIAYGIPA